MSKKIESQVNAVNVPAGSYAAVWSPNGTWGVGLTAFDAWTEARKPSRFAVYVFPEECGIYDVTTLGFKVAFEETEEGAEMSKAFSMDAAIALQVFA